MSATATRATGSTSGPTGGSRRGLKHASALAHLRQAAEKLERRAARVDVLLADADPERVGVRDPSPTCSDPHRLPLADLRAARADAEIRAGQIVAEIAVLLEALGSEYVM